MFERICNISKKELFTYFSSPAALIFLVAFLAINLFVFFSLELFFARNIADARPLFEWIPLLMIFLASSLTMKMWSEERRAGTLEFLQTLPVTSTELVLGKFFACLSMVVIALALTLPIPITVAFLGDLDWGPVGAGYLAAIFLSGAYIAIGLYVSSKTDNQIVALIISSLLCLAFFILGARPITNLFGTSGTGLLHLIGTGSRFESITRGVIDFRDLYYYLSIIGVFICLNIYALEQQRWFKTTASVTHKSYKTAVMLLCANLVAANLWLHQISSLRIDLTENNIYSISETTEQYLEQLQEPLLIRGYFSEKTHPLLAPLTIQLKDLLAEYEVAGKGKVVVEIFDPRENPELEQDAAQNYGIKPVPFQISDKYEAKLVNSYFDIVIQYGDKYQTLNFQDLIEVKAITEEQMEVNLRNPEYDITRSIKKVLYEFQSIDNLFDKLPEPVNFVGYISSKETLPKQLVELKSQLDSVLDKMVTDSNGKLIVSISDPLANGGAVAQEIAQNFGFTPMRPFASPEDTYYFYMTLQKGETVIQIPIPQENAEEKFKEFIQAGLQRFSKGFLKTVAIYTPPESPRNPMMPQMGPQGKQFRVLEQKLIESYNIRRTDLSNGFVSGEADILLLVSPENLNENQVFAVDQFLMKGGTVVINTSPFSISRSQNAIIAKNSTSGLEKWLKHNGIEIENSMVLDEQSGGYPIQVQKGIIQELHLIQYPYFIDIRDSGMPTENAPTKGIPQLSMSWSSPLKISNNLESRTSNIILKSSDNAWTSSSLNMIPDQEKHGRLGFPEGKNKQAYNLAGIIEGEFKSFFAGKEIPMLNQAKDDAKPDEDKEKVKKIVTGIVNKSPDSSRLVIFASNEFVEDQVIRLGAMKQSADYLAPIMLFENTIDWSLADRELLAIRTRNAGAKILEVSEPNDQLLWELGNYLAALLLAMLTFFYFKYSAHSHLRDLQSKLKGNYA
ncbi:MAG: Gldg family protein [Bdellovibrionota bacterium]